jgi:hypothetical protein
MEKVDESDVVVIEVLEEGIKFIICDIANISELFHEEAVVEAH